MIIIPGEKRKHSARMYPWYIMLQIFHTFGGSIFINVWSFGKIVPRYYSNVSLKNQKKLAKAIKRARIMALIPFVKSFDPNFEG